MDPGRASGDVVPGLSVPDGVQHVRSRLGQHPNEEGAADRADDPEGGNGHGDAHRRMPDRRDTTGHQSQRDGEIGER